MNVLLVGGSRSVQGGVEQFCVRAEEALTSIGRHRVEHIFSDAAYLRPKTLPRLAACMGALVRRRNADWDCVWLQYSSFPDLVVLVVCRLLGYRVLVTPHVGRSLASIRNPVLHFVGLRLLSTANGIALLSDSQMEELVLPASSSKCTILTFLPKALAPSRVGPPAGGAPPVRLVHAARLSRGKGSFLFIEVCAILKRAGLAFSARLIGPSDEQTRQELESLISERNLQGDVAFLGPMPGPVLLGELSQADVLVHLSELDALPLIVLESIGCDVFPICLDLPGARHITRSYCGHVVGHPDADRKAADFILSQDRSSLKNRAGLAGARLRRDYDWSNCVSVCERALSDMTGLRKAAPVEDVPR
ncbi:Glycosyltransferase involved in cell wall bisynthesis [Rhodospirillales bacterium URHD0017]|nr:Glycosyltransferase involved in cell wall bisynthesis [Rhodospirillales bacterium URHD0017]